MSEPYVSVPITGFNASPPPDDGTTSAANQLTWQKHLDKIGSPLKTAVEAINANLLTAFSKIFGNGVLEKSASYVVTVSDIGKFVSVTGTSTITLPAAASAGEGFPLVVINNGVAVVTIDGNASELINGGTSIALAANEGALLTTDGAEWTALIVRAAVPIVEGTFEATLTGVNAVVTATVSYKMVDDDEVTITIGTSSFVGTSNTNALSFTGIPAAIRPTTAFKEIVTPVIDNGSVYVSSTTISSGGAASFTKPNASQIHTATNFTTSGSKGLMAGTIIKYRR